MALDICLIPMTRPLLVGEAIRSAKACGWKVIVEDGAKGAPVTREKLFNAALSLGARYVRYSDDDDPGIKGSVNDILENSGADILYGDYHLISRGHTLTHRYTGNVLKDLLYGMGIPPWAWIGKAGSLARLVPLWDSTVVRGDGSWMVLRALYAGLKIVHIPAVIYTYRKTYGLPTLTNSFPMFSKECLRDWTSHFRS